MAQGGQRRRPRLLAVSGSFRLRRPLRRPLLRPLGPLRQDPRHRRRVTLVRRRLVTRGVGTWVRRRVNSDDDGDDPVNSEPQSGGEGTTAEEMEPQSGSGTGPEEWTSTDAEKFGISSEDEEVDEGHEEVDEMEEMEENDEIDRADDREELGKVGDTEDVEEDDDDEEVEEEEDEVDEVKVEEPESGGYRLAEGDRVVVVMDPGQTLTLHGCCELRCLRGRLELLGFELAPSHAPTELLSPRTHRALSLRALPDPHGDPHGKGDGTARLRQSLTAASFSAGAVERLLRWRRGGDGGAGGGGGGSGVTAGSAVLVLRRLHSPLVRFLSEFSPTPRLLSPSSGDPHRSQGPLHAAGVEEVGETEGIAVSESYRHAIDTIVTACRREEGVHYPVVLVCGKRNSGKSTFNRFLLNSLLNHMSRVQYLECDVGQTEFTPPGCISLHDVTQPLFGPPFGHPREAASCVFYGDVSPERDPSRYVASVRSVVLASGTRRLAPLIVNTMGWVQGNGLALLVDLCRMLRPSHVVQMSPNGVEAQPLTAATLRALHGWETVPEEDSHDRDDDEEDEEERDEEEEEEEDHELLEVVNSFASIKGYRAMPVPSNVLRELSLLAYLSQLQPPGARALWPLHRLPPYEVPLSSVALHCAPGAVAPAHILYALNARVVGLCRAPPGLPLRPSPTVSPNAPLIVHGDLPPCHCYGLGVVRGVDAPRGTLLILTPLAPERLRLVNLLVLGNVPLPPLLLKKQHGVRGELPYVSGLYSVRLAGSGQLRVTRNHKRPGRQAQS
uniref:Polynucleotide 5'-hydroxyl-kinase NOL9 n=1 Tax=Petromyzon marinus TaxID=7757 RepID=A0AAJ7XAN9_PETMA|nr:polynucleotide 5'-hydroxyl-kinase NOL9 [Petromyzon marinus]